MDDDEQTADAQVLALMDSLPENSVARVVLRAVEQAERQWFAGETAPTTTRVEFSELGTDAPR
jgi:hypothetical protein